MLANRIAAATEDQGSALYATKAHMRSWAAAMIGIIDDATKLLLKEHAVAKKSSDSGNV
jgi:hypothetical protein